MTSPPTRTANGSNVSGFMSMANNPNTAAPSTCMAMPRAVGRPTFPTSLERTSFPTRTFGSASIARTPSSFLSQVYSASHFDGVILTYITIITI